MKQQAKFIQKQDQVAEHQIETKAAKEFSNSDEMLRFDATQTGVPPQIAERLKQSAAQIPPSRPRAWWRNLFGG
jgi:hypothetical protein